MTPAGSPEVPATRRPNGASPSAWEVADPRARVAEDHEPVRPEGEKSWRGYAFDADWCDDTCPVEMHGPTWENRLRMFTPPHVSVTRRSDGERQRIGDGQHSGGDHKVPGQMGSSARLRARAR